MASKKAKDKKKYQLITNDSKKPKNNTKKTTTPSKKTKTNKTNSTPIKSGVTNKVTPSNSSSKAKDEQKKAEARKQADQKKAQETATAKGTITANAILGTTNPVYDWDYTTTDDALGLLGRAITERKTGETLHVNDLDAYLSKQLRNDYSPFIDYGDILNKYNDQSDAAWELARQEQKQAMNMAEAQNYANTQNAISELRRNLIGSASSGGNVGAANATALQALLGLGQQNAQTTTEALQAYQNVNKEQASARAANAVSALDSAREGVNSMYDQATSAYGADHTYGVQGAFGAYQGLQSSLHTDATNKAMNKLTAEAQIKAAQLEKEAQIKAAQEQAKGQVAAAKAGANTTSNNKNININKKG